MKIKSYFVDSVETAVVQARKELGVDAMLIETRRTPAATRALGAYEVVFGIVEETQAAEQAPQIAAVQAPPPPGLADLAEIRRQIADLQLALASSTPQIVKAPERDNELDDWRGRMLRAEVADAVANEVRQAVEEQFSAGPMRPAGEQLNAAVRRELAQRIRISNPFSNEHTARVLALVGPPGSGKTVTAVKLAAQEGIATGGAVHFISVDPYRIGASEQLRAYASLLGAGFDEAQTFGELAQAMTECSRRDLVIIDTPGFSAAEKDSAQELAHLLGHFEEISIHLVLPASMRAADLTRAAEVFDVFGPHSLIFTRLDETEAWGAMLSQSARTGVGISYLCAGQSIPEDLERASADAILAKIFGPLQLARSVA